MSEPRAMTGRVTLGNGEVRHLASPGTRLAARIIDIALVVIVAITLAIVGIVGLLASSEAGQEAAGALLFLGFGGAFLVFLILLIYEPALIATRGQTVGKMIMGIKVVRAEDGGLPGWGKAIGRWVLPGLVSLIPFAGWFLQMLVYLSLVWDDRRQGWHDKMGTTVVITA